MTTPTTLPDARAALLHTVGEHGWRRLCGDLSEKYVKVVRWRLREPLTPRTLTPDENDVSDLPLFATRAG